MVQKYLNKPLEETAFTLIAVVLYTYSIITYGQGVTDDSVNYFSAALSDFPILEKVDGSIFIEWPLLYPLILSLYKYTPFTIITFAEIIHGVVLFISIYFINYFISRHVTSRLVEIASRITFSFSTPILLVHVFVWSEGIFILFLICSIFYLNKFLIRKKNRDFFLLILFSILMSLQRKTGIIISFGVFICLLTQLKPYKPSSKILISLFYLFVSSLPFLFYILRRNFYSSQYFTSYSPEPKRIDENILHVLNILSTWIFPDEINLWIRIALGLIMLIVFYLITKFSTRIIHLKLKEFEASLLILFLTYIAFIIIGFLFLKLDQEFDDRVFAPIYFPGMLLFILLIDATYRKMVLLPVNNSYLLRKIMAILIILWLAYPVSRALTNATYWNDYGGGGYNSQYWRDNDIIDWVIKNSSKYNSISASEIFPLYYHINVKRGNKSKVEYKKTGDAEINICFNHCKIKKGDRVLFKSREGLIITNKN